MVDAGTIAYMPPECFEGPAQSSPAIDIWAIGLMFYAMLYGTLPFYGENESKTKQKIRECRLRFPSDVPVTEMAKEVMRAMLTKDPEERIGLLQFMDLPYYSMEDNELERHIEEVKNARQEIEAAEEEKRNEEQKMNSMVHQFNSTLDIPSWQKDMSVGSMGSSGGRRHNNG